MKRRIALVLAVLLAFTALAPQLAARADGVCFTVVNETVYDLSAGTMPQAVAGVWSVPYTVFGNSAFGLYYTYSSARRTLTFMNADQTVIFDLSIGIAYTDDGTIYNARAASRGGTVYVPVGFMCQMFGWSWSYLETGPCVRIRTGAARVDDELFLGLMKGRLEEKKNAYLGMSKPTEPPTEAPTPSPTPPPTPEPTASPEPIKQISMALYGPADDALDPMLTELENMGHSALVFLTPQEDFSHRDEDLLRLVSGDHVVGFDLAPPESLTRLEQDAWLRALESYNDAFFRVTLTRVRAIHLTGGSGALTGDGAEAFLRRLSEAGYALWDYTAVVDNAPGPESLRRRFADVSGWQLLAFPISDAGAAGLSSALRLTATQPGWRGRSVTEFSTPRNQWGVR